MNIRLPTTPGFTLFPVSSPATEGAVPQNTGLAWMVRSQSPEGFYLGSCLRDFAADLRKIRGVVEPVEMNVHVGLNAQVALYVLDGETCPTATIRERFRYLLNPILSESLDQERPTTSRPLLEASFRGISDDILYLDFIQTHRDFHGKGIGRAFYRQLQSLGRQFGYRFLAQRHIDRAANDFFLNRGCYNLDDVKQDLRPGFSIVEEEDPPVPHWNGLYTIDFLYPEDAGRYVAGGRLRR